MPASEIPGMEELRARARATLKKSASTAGLAQRPTTSQGALRPQASQGSLRPSSFDPSSLGLSNTAVESVHSGLVQSLESDCRNYRAEVKSLHATIRKLEEKLSGKANSEAAQKAAAEARKLEQEHAKERLAWAEEARNLQANVAAATQEAAELTRQLVAARNSSKADALKADARAAAAELGRVSADLERCEARLAAELAGREEDRKRAVAAAEAAAAAAVLAVTTATDSGAPASECRAEYVVTPSRPPHTGPPRRQSASSPACLASPRRTCTWTRERAGG